MRRHRPYGLLFVLALLAGLAGCGVAATSRPVDEGDPAAGVATGTDVVRTLHTPNDADSPAELVRYFLQAAVGGLPDANDKVKQFLTPEARQRWRDPVDVERPPLSVIRIVRSGTPVADADGRTRVTVDYETVGTMSDQGRIDDLVPVAQRRLTFWIVPEGDLYLRIDEIDGWPGGLLISDEALREYYRIQPVYFWDTGARLLIPDLRYLPLTMTTDQRAVQILRWLFAGASSWLGGAQRLPSGLSPGTVVTDSDGTLVVNLSGEADSPEALARLKYQIQWSLFPPGGAVPDIELRLNEQPVSVEGEFRRYNHAWTYDDPEPDLYDITANGEVIAVEGTPTPPVLAAPENAGVVSAAIDDGGKVAALVRAEPSGLRRLVIVRDGQPLVTGPAGFTVGRPAFVPETDVVLLPLNGRLLAVSTVDGSATDATHQLELAGVTAAAVSPDGRRVAVVADGKVHVSSLAVGSQVTVGSNTRRILTGRLDARAVTWLSETRLLVGGSSAQAPALWRVSADGVLVEDLSSRLSSISRVDDLVCYPSWAARATSVDVLAVTPPGVYTFRNQIGPSQDLRAPFYGT